MPEIGFVWRNLRPAGGCEPAGVRIRSLIDSNASELTLQLTFGHHVYSLRRDRYIKTGSCVIPPTIYLDELKSNKSFKHQQMNLFPTPVKSVAIRYFGVAFFLAVSSLSVSEAQAQTRITFDDATRIAIDQSIELKKAENSVTLQEQAVRQAKASFLPNLNASSGTARNWGLSFDQTSFQLVTESTDNFNSSLSSSVNLFNGFGDVASLASQRHLLESDKYSLERQRQTVFFNVVSAYLQILLDQEQVEIRAEDVESQLQQLSRIEEFTRLGARPISDLYAQQATTAQSELSLLDAERAVEISKVRLIQILELDPFEEYEFDAPNADGVPLDVTSYDLQALLRSSLERRADLKARDASIMSAAEGIRVAKSGRYPSLNLSGSLGTSYSSARTTPLRDSLGNVVIGTSFSDQLKDNRSRSVRLSLNIPIFNRLQTTTNVQRSRIQYDNQVLDRQNEEQSVLLEVRQGYLDYQSAAKRLDVTEKQMVSATQAEQVESERYNVGASTLVELTAARATLVSAASNRAQAVYQFLFQSKVIDYYVGVLDTAEGFSNN